MKKPSPSRFCRCISVFLMLSGTLFADTISPTNENIRYVGRFDTSIPEAPRMHWSGTHIVAWFEGTSCEVKLNCAGGNDFFNIIVDDGEPVMHGLDAGSQTIIAASGLSNGVHKVEVFKRTSFKVNNSPTERDSTAFEGFVTEAGKGLAAPAPERALKIQFYGDSITDGYAVDSLSNNSAPIFWNNYLTYAAITARNLKMEYVSTSASAIAVLYPWPDEGAGFIMDNYYDRIVPDVSGPSNQWDFAQYVPDIVVVNLFQNDSWVNSSPHSPQEQDDIVNAYEGLLLKIRAAHPDAELICCLGSMDATQTGSVWPGYIDATVARMNDTHGDAKVSSLFFPDKGGYMYNHPTAAQQMDMADLLTQYIQTNLNYLFTSDRDGDEFIDVDETALGTNPDDPASLFEVRVKVTSAGTDKIQLAWPSQTGVRYRVWESPDSLTGWNLACGWLEAQTPPEDFLELDLTPSNGFFKVEAEIQ